MNSTAKQIIAQNTHRDPERLRVKFKALRADPFAFFRGTCPLFYASLPRDAVLLAAPAVHICGDLHLENFGSYKGDNRLTYFDINDFDEAALAPFTFDLIRLLASIHVAGRMLRWPKGSARAVCATFTDTYRASIANGKARWIERATASGMVESLLRTVKKRSRLALLADRTKLMNGQRVIRIDPKRALAASDTEQLQAGQLIKLACASEAEHEFFRVLDVVRRVAGNASLGTERYTVLVEGRCSPDMNFVLDIKQAAPSCLLPLLSQPQPAWRCDADRIVGTQQLLQASVPALLRPVMLDDQSFVLKELQPSADRLELRQCNGRTKRLNDVVRSMAAVTAWAHLRGAGRWGAAPIEAVQHTCADSHWADALYDLSRDAARTAIEQWREYADAYDAGLVL